MLENLRSALVTGPFAWVVGILAIAAVTIAYFALKARVAAQPSRYVRRGDRW